MQDHLDDSVINEYLDSALEPARRAEVEAHLADCPACAARLAELRALFAALESLPDSPLERDLSSAVLAALRRNELPARPVFRFIFAAQALAALALLAVALSFATQASFWNQVRPSTAVAEAADALTAFNAGLADLFNTAQSSLDEMLATLNNLPLPSLPVFSLGAVFAAVSALWLVGNGLLLTRAYQLKR